MDKGIQNVQNKNKDRIRIENYFFFVIEKVIVHFHVQNLYKVHLIKRIVGICVIMIH